MVNFCVEKFNRSVKAQILSQGDQMHIIYILYIICSFVVVMLPGDNIFQDITTPG